MKAGDLTGPVMPGQPRGAEGARAPSSPVGAVDPLAALAAGSDRPEVQALIRKGIRDGTIRVVPDAGCPDRVRVVRNVSPRRPD